MPPDAQRSPARPRTTASSDLPAELWHPIADRVVAAYIDELLSRIPGVDGATLHTLHTEPAPHPVASLLRLSYTARHVTLRVLAQYLDAPYIPTGAGRLGTDPRARLALVLALWRVHSDAAQRAARDRACTHGPVLAAYAHRAHGVRTVQALASELLRPEPRWTGAQHAVNYHWAVTGYADDAHGAFCAARDAAADARCPALVRERFDSWHAPLMELLDACALAIAHACCFTAVCRYFAAAAEVPLSRIPVVFNHGFIPAWLDKLAPHIARLSEEHARAQRRADGAHLLTLIDAILGGRTLKHAIPAFAQLGRLELPEPRHAALPADARACEDIAAARLAAHAEWFALHGAYAVDGDTALVPLRMPAWAPGTVRAVFLYTLFVVVASRLV
ncbi:hypothetical protein PsYK624_131920 [Phanerochaete sordida]|uniref:Uncharacterized protein n=1 Tax=Phanerochaete sordida TaxID=48140 RepID=A0A9P3GK41_9APHY|nr:hypothetical protein PsYK624_131920 [Phanerochaete sordida]